MTGRATEALLDQLHGMLADVLKEELEAARKGDEPINPQLLDKVMKFLVSNGINAPKGSPKVDALAAELGELDLDQEVIERPRRH